MWHFLVKDSRHTRFLCASLHIFQYHLFQWYQSRCVFCQQGLFKVNFFLVILCYIPVYEFYSFLVYCRLSISEVHFFLNSFYLCVLQFVCLSVRLFISVLYCFSVAAAWSAVLVLNLFSFSTTLVFFSLFLCKYDTNFCDLSQFQLIYSPSFFLV